MTLPDPPAASFQYHTGPIKSVGEVKFEGVVRAGFNTTLVQLKERYREI